VKTARIAESNPEIGRGREIRTPDILLPKQARYQTALYPDVIKIGAGAKTPFQGGRIILTPPVSVNAKIITPST
jgi:hypothetical protein